MGSRSRGRPGCGDLFGDERMTGGIPMAVFWCVENLANRRCLAHRCSQRDKLDSSLLTKCRETCLQIPRLPAQTTTSRRKHTEVAIHPEFDWNVVDDQRNPMFARHLGAMTQGHLRYLQPLSLILTDFAGGVEIKEIESLHSAATITKPAKAIEPIRDQPVAHLACLHEQVVRERAIDELAPAG